MIQKWDSEETEGWNQGWPWEYRALRLWEMLWSEHCHLLDQSRGLPWYTAFISHFVIHITFPQTLCHLYLHPVQQRGYPRPPECQSLSWNWIFGLEVKYITTLLLAFADSILSFQLFEKFKRCSNLMLLPQHSLEYFVLGGWAAKGSPELVSEAGHLLSDHRTTQLCCSIWWCMLEGLQSWKVLGSNKNKGKGTKTVLFPRVFRRGT